MADTTDGIPTNAGAWEYLYDLITARRIATGQTPLSFPHARRIKFLATGVVKLCKDPKDDPIGETVPATPAAPMVVESGSRLNNESLRVYYTKGGGTLQVEMEY